MRALRHVRGPRRLARDNGQSINGFEVQSNEIGDLPKVKLGTGSKKYIAMEDGTHLRMHAEHEKFGIQTSTRRTPTRQRRACRLMSCSGSRTAGGIG